MSNRNPQVDTWFADRDGPMTEAMQLARKLILDADPRIEETIKWKTPIANAADVEAAKEELQSVIRAWCNSR